MKEPGVFRSLENRIVPMEAPKENKKKTVQPGQRFGRWTVQEQQILPANSRSVSSANWAAAETNAVSLPFISEAARP